MVYVRRDIWDLETEQVWHPVTLAYAKAISRMNEDFPATDPRHLTYQAAIHGVPNGTQLEPGWDQCEHADWFFLPWHRMYLYYFESIVRSLVALDNGPEDWALPYWNYDGGGEKSTLPKPFREETLPGQPGVANPLYVEDRGWGINDGTEPLEPEITTPAAALATSIFAQPPRPSFGGGRLSPPFGNTGQLEQTPHNDVHVAIGGLMGDPATAGLDPIFWLHHANIDRLWNEWARDPNHTPPSQGGWQNQEYTFFDENGASQSKQSKDVLSTLNQLNYRYDVDPVPFEEIARVPKEPLGKRPPAELIGASQESARLVGRPVSVPVAIDREVNLERIRNERAPSSRIVLSVEHVDAEVNPGVVYGVYLEGLDPDRPVHVGNVSLFGIERIHRQKGVEQAHDLRLDFDVTEVVGDQVDRLGDIKVRFAPLRLDPEKRRRVAEENAEVHPAIEVGRVSFTVD
jgi:hypothetical protein